MACHGATFRSADGSPQITLETDCLAGHVRLELKNVSAKYPFERSRRFPEIQANSGNADRSRLSCEVGDTQLGPNARISAECVARGAWSSRRIPETAGIVAILGRSSDARNAGSGWNRRRLMASHYAGLPRFFPGARSDRRPDRALVGNALRACPAVASHTLLRSTRCASHDARSRHLSDCLQSTIKPRRHSAASLTAHILAEGDRTAWLGM